MNINPAMIWLLRSPLHRFLSSTTMLVTYHGRKSGREICLPVNYVRDGEQLLTLSVRRRAWWRNFKQGGPATLRLKGHDIPAQVVIVNEESELLRGLGIYMKKMPQAANYLKIHFDAQGEPDLDDLREAADGRVLLRFQPRSE